MLDNEVGIWESLSFANKIRQFRVAFRTLFRKQAGADPPHEAFVSWFLSMCSSGRVDIESENIHFQISDYPSLDPWKYAFSRSSCSSVSILEAIETLSRELSRVWNNYSCSMVNRDWITATVEGDSVRISYPEDDINHPIPHEVLEHLSRTHRGGCRAADIAVLYHKYDALFGFSNGEGRGWHLTIPDEFYDILINRFNLSCELFASPINRRSSHFFSLFASDSAFGSLGNFFSAPTNFTDFKCLFGDPPSLTLEANPPFQPLVMMRFAVRILELIKAADACDYTLLCVVVFPNWPACDPVRLLLSTPYLLRSIKLEKGAHKYKPGWGDIVSYEADRAYWERSESLVLFLGSAKARLSYSIDDELESRMRQSWCNN